MKKVALSLAGVLAAAAFAPEAAAVPAFARQTGMACSACHAQHFPVLNGFGRAFKAAGFTMMGSQEKVEGEHLSIPAALNFGMLIKARYQKTNGTYSAPLDSKGAAVKGANTNDGQWQIPDEYSMFWGGRVADNGTVKIGTMTEFDAAKGGTTGLRIPIVFDMDSVKLSVIPFATDALGPFYGYTESSTGVARGVRWAEHRKEISAHQYVGMGSGKASGIGFVAHTDMGYINVSRWSPNLFFPGDASGGTTMSSTAFTIAATPTIADFAVVAGVQILRGTNTETKGHFDPTKTFYTPESFTYKSVDTKATGFDVQAHGEVAGMEAGFYGAYAKGDAAGFYGDKKALTLGADFTVIPHTLSLGAAIRSAKNKGVADNATTLTAVYDLAQNVALHANYTKYGTRQKLKNGADMGDMLFTGMLEVAW